MASTSPALEGSSRRGMRRAGVGFLDSIVSAMLSWKRMLMLFLLCPHVMFRLASGWIIK